MGKIAKKRAKQNEYYRRWYHKHRAKEARERASVRQERHAEKQHRDDLLELISKGILTLIDQQKKKEEEPEHYYAGQESFL